jgi:hypothetical protein
VLLAYSTLRAGVRWRSKVSDNSGERFAHYGPLRSVRSREAGSSSSAYRSVEMGFTREAVKRPFKT